MYEVMIKDIIEAVKEANEVEYNYHFSNSNEQQNYLKTSVVDVIECDQVFNLNSIDYSRFTLDDVVDMVEKVEKRDDYISKMCRFSYGLKQLSPRVKEVSYV